MKAGRAWLKKAGLVPRWIAEAALRQHRRRTAAIFVLSDGESYLEEKVPAFTDLLRAGMRPHGFSTVSPATSAMAGRWGEPSFDAALLQVARGSGAEYILAVAMREICCRVDDAGLTNLAALRVDTTICVEFQVIETGSGRLLVRNTLAHGRTTSPIVRGTSIGNEVVDLLLSEIAAQIARHLGSLPVAA